MNKTTFIKVAKILAMIIVTPIIISYACIIPILCFMSFVVKYATNDFEDLFGNLCDALQDAKDEYNGMYDFYHTTIKNLTNK